MPPWKRCARRPRCARAALGASYRRAFASRHASGALWLTGLPFSAGASVIMPASARLAFAPPFKHFASFFFGAGELVPSRAQHSVRDGAA